MSIHTQPGVTHLAQVIGPKPVPVGPPVIADVFASDLMIAEFTSIDFDLSDSTAPFCAIATNAAELGEVRRVAARAAIERADDYVLHARHALSDGGTGVTAIAVEAAEDDVVLDAALAIYALEEFEPGDEHLFGVDMAAIVFSCDRAANADSWYRQYRQDGDTEPWYTDQFGYADDLRAA